MIGMLFDLKKCDIQYIFKNNAFSKDWLNKKDSFIPPQISLDELRMINSQARKEGIVLENNEILAGLSTDSLVGVFSTKNNLFSRLNALAKQHLIKCSLNKMLPVLIITPQDGVIVYDEQQKIRDIQTALSKDKNDPARILVDNDIDIPIKQSSETLTSKVKTITEEKIDNHHHRYLENKNFLTNTTIPHELKAMVIDYIDFVDLTKYAHDVANSAEDKIIQNLIIKEFNKKRESDLSVLISEISQPINVETVFKITIKETDDFATIERAIIHLCYLNPQGAGQVLSDYIYQFNRPNPHIISAFLRYCPIFEIRKQQKKVVLIEGNENAWEHDDPDIVINMQQWSPLVGAILSNNSFIANLIVSRHAKHIPDIIAALNELHKISRNYPKNCDYSLDQITAARKTLLLQLKQEHSEHYTLTYEDKRLIEDHLFSEISHIRSRTSLHTFYQQHADSLYLNQHRHATYDSMKQKLFPHIKKNILTALKEQSMKISDETDFSLEEKDKETLDNEKLNLKSILKTKRDALLRQNRGVTFFLFYSTTRTDEKIKIISESLEKLDAINNFSELRMFTENLLLNNELTGRRSLGITASDTYIKVKEFYDSCFLVLNNGSNCNKNRVYT